jgi:lipid A 4'-phosphatase
MSLRLETPLAWTAGFDVPHSSVLIAATAAAAVAFFALLPTLDLNIASWLYLGDGKWAGKPNKFVSAWREVFIWTFISASVLSVAGLIITRSMKRLWLGLAFVQWLFVAACLVIGPGVVANLVIKDNSGRARPREVIELGGEKLFTPALVRSKQCTKNCSFVSGEAASMFALFFAGAVLWRRRAAAFVTAGIACGFAAGFVRMAQGAHFFSDVVFAGIVMAGTVWIIRWSFVAIAEGSRYREAALGESG